MKVHILSLISEIRRKGLVRLWINAFNGDDAMAKFMRTMSAYKAEGSNEERQKKSVQGTKKAIREGRYTFPPKQIYKAQNRCPCSSPDYF